MNKFTPGPWRYRAPDRDTMQRHKVFGPPHPVDGGDYAPLAEFSNGDDAILTASAPDMARALEAAKVALGAAIMIADAQAADAARRATRDANNMHTVNVHLEAKGRWEKLAAEWTIARDEAAEVLVNAVGEG